MYCRLEEIGKCQVGCLAKENMHMTFFEIGNLLQKLKGDIGFNLDKNVEEFV
jgi:hypothetical protein